MNKVYVAYSNERPNGIAWGDMERAERSKEYLEKCKHTNIRIEEEWVYWFFLKRTVRGNSLPNIVAEIAEQLWETLKSLFDCAMAIGLLLIYPITMIAMTFVNVKNYKKEYEERLDK